MHFAEKHPLNESWAVMEHYRHPTTGEDCLAVLAHVYGDDRAQRARMYAAAPELLAALIACRNCLTPGRDDAEDRAARAALAKAGR